MNYENWQDIPGYEGYYQVSDLGRVRSITRERPVKSRYGEIIRRDQGKIIRGTSNGNGYLAVHLRKDGARERKYIHRLVAEAFVPKPYGKDTINHKDHNRGNNNMANLEWCTQGDNVRYSAHLMRHEKTRCKESNTGYKYISKMKNDQYRVYIDRLKVCKSFKYLCDAITFRDEVMIDA